MMPNITEIEIPQTLQDINEIPMGKLVKELQQVNNDPLDETVPKTVWYWVSTALTGLGVICCCKKNCKSIACQIKNCLPYCIREGYQNGQAAILHGVELRPQECGGKSPPVDSGPSAEILDSGTSTQRHVECVPMFIYLRQVMINTLHRFNCTNRDIESTDIPRKYESQTLY